MESVCVMPNISKIVGVISPRLPVLIILVLSVKIAGTGFMVCAVCFLPVSESIFTSALPWSAVIKATPPFCCIASTTLFNSRSTFSIPFIIACLSAVCPTISALAKFTKIKSVPLFISAIVLLAISSAIISGAKS